MNPSSRAAQILEGVETEVVIQRYADRILVLVSQIGKVGNLIQASIPPTAHLEPPSTDTSSLDSVVLVEPPPAIELTPLLGAAPNDALASLYSLYTTHIATLIWTLSAQQNHSDRLSVIVGIALKSSQTNNDGITESTRSTFRGVLKLVHDLIRS